MKRAALFAGVSVTALVAAGPTSAAATVAPNSVRAAYRPRSGSDRRRANRQGALEAAREARRKTEHRPTSRRPAARAAAHHRLDRQTARHAVRQWRCRSPHRGLDRHARPPDADGRVHGHPEGPPSHLQSLRCRDALHAAHHLVGLRAAPGPLPGYPASHGCVRLTAEFAQLLWKTTKLGARVIVTQPDVAPVEIDHAHLFAPKPKPVEAAGRQPGDRPVARSPGRACVDVAAAEPATTSS